MKRILAYSTLLVSGMLVSQIFNLAPFEHTFKILAQLCLGVIMIEAGLEFSADLKHPKTYATDALVSVSASLLPWALTALYFIYILGTEWRDASLVACFAAPTSAGVLFTLLAAAGLSTTWVFKKARVLAVLDDLATLLLLVPLQILVSGWKTVLLLHIFITLGLVYAAMRWANTCRWSVRKPWLVLYSVALIVLSKFLEKWTTIHVEMLLPAFVAGCILRHRSMETPEDPRSVTEGDDPQSALDQSIKGLFLFLVGAALPKIPLADVPWVSVALHVFALTVLGNLGKCVPLFFYKQEASPRSRAALCVALFPRGEVGAGVLFLALGSGISGLPVLVGSLSLALNLCLTGVFITIVRRLLK